MAKLENEDIVICKKSVIHNGVTLFENGCQYKFVRISNFGNIEMNDDDDGFTIDINDNDYYVLDRVDNGVREFFYNIWSYNKYFTTLKGMRKLKLEQIGIKT